MTFIESLTAAWTKNNSLLCVGLDPDPAKFPAHLQGKPDAIFEFCKGIVDATADLVCVHVEAPDEASHQGDAAEKVKAIEECFELNNFRQISDLKAKLGDKFSYAEIRFVLKHLEVNY